GLREDDLHRAGFELAAWTGKGPVLRRGMLDDLASTEGAVGAGPDESDRGPSGTRGPGHVGRRVDAGLGRVQASSGSFGAVDGASSGRLTRPRASRSRAARWAGEGPAGTARGIARSRGASGRCRTRSAAGAVTCEG